MLDILIPTEPPSCQKQLRSIKRDAAKTTSRQEHLETDVTNRTGVFFLIINNINFNIMLLWSFWVIDIVFEVQFTVYKTIKSREPKLYILIKKR